jgi:hypothetical protein
VHELQVETALAVGEAQVEEAAHEGLGDLRGHALHQLVEGGAARERLHELLVVEDAVADLLQLVLGEVEERAPLELLGIDAVVDAGERHARGLDLPHEAVGVHGRLGQGRRLHHDGEVVEVAELLVVLAVPLDVGGARHERAGGRREGQRGERVDHRDDRQGGGRQERHARTGARQPNEPAQKAAGPGRRRQDYSSPAMNRSRR